MDNRYNRHNRRKYSLKVHMVLVTKYRKQLLKGNIADDVKQKIFDICSSNNWNVIAMETDKDHVHFIIYGRNILTFCPSGIGKRKSFGLTVILRVA